MKKSFVGEKDRRIVPRWREYCASLDISAEPQVAEAAVLSQSFFENQEHWRTDPSLWNALDFIADAIVEARIDLASEAIEQVRQDVRLPAAGAAIIKSALASSGDSDPPKIQTVEEESMAQIRASRRRLAEHQWDAVEWIDLARSYTNLGQTARASKCIGAATRIAPSNRFVIRAASRFYVHTSDPERALWLIQRAGASDDPWLMAPQVAISAIVGHSSAFARAGLQMLKRDFSAADLSELRAALGTIDIENGKLVHGKRLLRQALTGANENSVAQVEWLNRSQLGDVIDISMVNPPRLYEAGAWSAFATGEWEEARRLSALWFRDQPFSGNAAIVCSYVLSEIIHDFDAAKQVLTTALRCNRDHPILLNNMAYACIKLGELREAEQYLALLPSNQNADTQGASQATRGLLDFRNGDPESGRGKFLEAIASFTSAGSQDMAGRAAAHLALEELRSDTPFSIEAVQRSLTLTEGSRSPHVLHKMKEVEEAVRELAARERGSQIAQ